ncbi:MAG: NB-ARC domain-containing protein [Microvirga sp.]|nr:NB-ARC domain-containing protein [Microvirga sp.]
MEFLLHVYEWFGSVASAVIAAAGWVWGFIAAEFRAAPLSATASLLAIPGGAYWVVKWAARRRAKSILDSFKPAEINERRKVFGRDRAVADLRDILSAGGQGAVVPVRTGGGGVGKTTLCRHYARIHAADYDRIEFLRAETEQSLIADLAALALRMDSRLREEEGLRPLALRARDMIRTDAAEKRWLAIFDNVETPEIMQQWGMQAPRLHVLVTSRFPDWKADGFVARRLAVLEPEDAVALLRNEAGRDDDGFPALAETLGRLPLALVQAGEWMRANPGRTAQDFAGSVEHLRERVAAPGMTSEHDRTTAAVVELTLARIGRDAQALADILAWIAPDNLDESLLERLALIPWWRRWRHEISMQVPSRVWWMARDELRRRAAFAELRHAALLEDDVQKGGLYRMHRVFQAVIRARAGSGKHRDFVKARAASAVLAAQFPERSDLVFHWPLCRVLLPHVAAIWDAARPLWEKAAHAGGWGRPGWPAMDYLLNQARVYLSTQADYRRAIDLGRATLLLHEARLGEDDRNFPLGLGNLAVDLVQTGSEADLHEAEAMIARAVALNEAHRVEEGRIDLAASFMQQATVAFRRIERSYGPARKTAEAVAETALAGAWRIRRELRGDTSAEISHVWSQTAYLRGLQGRKAAAMAASAQALAIHESLADSDRRLLGLLFMNVGSVALEIGRVDGTEERLRRAYQIFVAVLEKTPQHPEFKASADWLAICLCKRASQGVAGALEEAEALCARHGLSLEEMKADAAKLPDAPLDLPPDEAWPWSKDNPSS